MMENKLNTYDLSERQGIVYCIEFGSGHYYYGISKRSFKKRYVTKNLSKGCPQVVECAKTGWDAKILCDGLGWEDLSEIEALIVDEEMLKDPLCLNKDKGGSYKQAKWKGNHRAAITLVDPDGKEHFFKTHTEASEVIGCLRTSVSKLKAGTNKSVYGWHLVGVKPKRSRCKSVALEKDGVCKVFPSVKSAEEYIGCGRQAISHIINKTKGRAQSVYGWRIA
tara:strand:- start:135 stop:800 length:666 start_codon:yes stop_codon:yes gene_type:complete